MSTLGSPPTKPMRSTSITPRWPPSPNMTLTFSRLISETDGSMAWAIAIGSGRSSPSMPCSRANRRTACAMSTPNLASGVPMASIASWRSWVTIADVMEMSQPTNSNGIPDAVTIAAASGSAQKLNSAIALTLPGPCTPVPPMITTRSTASAISGARRTAAAMFESGPRHTRVTSPGEPRIVSTMTSTPRPAAGVRP